MHSSSVTLDSPKFASSTQLEQNCNVQYIYKLCADEELSRPTQSWGTVIMS